MPILNYTTTIEVDKTVAEIHRILAKAGAKRIETHYTDGEPFGVEFTIDIGLYKLSFRLPARSAGVYNSLMKSDAPKRYKTSKQANRVAWRILKDWAEAQLALIEAGMADVSEVFFPYLIDSNGETVYEDFRNHSLALGQGTDGTKDDDYTVTIINRNGEDATYNPERSE